MFFRILLLSLVLNFNACTEYTPPYLSYKASFDLSKVSESVSLIKELAEIWDLRVYEKSREEMKIVTQGADSFFVALYFDTDPVLIMSNAGFGDLLTLALTNYQKMPVGDLERLGGDVVANFESRLNVKFERILQEP